MTFVKGLKRFIADEKGLETLEYAIIGGLILAGTIATISAIGLWVSAKFNEINDNIQGE